MAYDQRVVVERRECLAGVCRLGGLGVGAGMRMAQKCACGEKLALGMGSRTPKHPFLEDLMSPPGWWGAAPSPSQQASSLGDAKSMQNSPLFPYRELQHPGGNPRSAKDRAGGDRGAWEHCNTHLHLCFPASLGS